MFDRCETLKMKNSLSCTVFYVLILGSYSSASSILAATTSSNSTFMTTDENVTISTLLKTASTFPTTAASETTVQPNTSSNPSSAFSTGSQFIQSVPTSGQTTGSGQGGNVQTALTTTISPGPWRVVTYALSAVSAVLLLAFTITVIILCKMKAKLGHASKTLYPITPGPDDHEYLDLEEGIKKKNKKGVELKNITVHHEDEEFDSPTFSPTPPAKPKRSFKKPPPVPSSNPPTDKSPDGAPQIPVRANKHSQPKLSRENIQGKSSDGENNPAFVRDEANNRNINLYEHDDDETYESYEHGKTAGSAGGMEDDDDMDIQGPYEEPVKSSARATEQVIQRQGSSTGLPDVAIQRIPSREKVQDAPLQVAEEETFDNEDFGNVDPDSGLPDITGMQNIDDLQFFDDPYAMTANVNEHSEVTGDTRDLGDEGEHEGAPSPTVESLDDLLTYDDADMDLADFDVNKNDGDEPGLYEDFSNENEMHFNIHSAFDKEDSASEGDIINTETRKNDIGLENEIRNRSTTNERSGANESELPTVPPRRKSTIDKSRGSTEQIASKSNSAINESSGLSDQTALPSVPPRRDLLRKQSESESAVGSFDEMVLADENPPEIKWDTFPTNNNPEDIVQLRPGKKVGTQGQERPRDSYFLDMEETPVELSENNTNSILADNKTGMSGLTELSESSEVVSELKGTGTEPVTSAELEEPGSAKTEKNYFFDNTTGSENSLHTNGNVPNSDAINPGGSAIGEGGFASWDNNDLLN